MSPRYLFSPFKFSPAKVNENDLGVGWGEENEGFLCPTSI